MGDSHSRGLSRAPSGFTIVELLVVTVLGALVLAAIYQVLIVNQRTYAAQEVEIRQQQGIRSGMLVLTSVLREVSGGDADIVAMGVDSIRIRSMRGFGILCDYDPTVNPVRMTVEKVGRWMEDDDSVFVFSDANPDVANDDEWLRGLITNVDRTVTCPAPNLNPAQEIRVSGLGTGAANGPTDVLLGAPARSYTPERYTYGLYTIGGDWWLGRRTGSADPIPIAGPLGSSGSQGVQFAYRDTLGNVTSDPGAVGQVRVTLRARSEMRDGNGNPLTDSITSRIWVRN